MSIYGNNESFPQQVAEELKVARQKGALGVIDFILKRWAMLSIKHAIGEWKGNRARAIAGEAREEAALRLRLVEESHLAAIREWKRHPTKAALLMMRKSIYQMQRDRVRCCVVLWRLGSLWPGA